MIEAMWSVHFISNSHDFGSGITVFETEKIFGGDAQYYWVGSYSMRGNTLDAKVKITHYAGEPWSIVGPIHEYSIEAQGAVQRDGWEALGHMVGNPDVRILMRFKRLAELPG